ncbi:MAG: ElyC/SanA/YdcF family protein [Anaerolineaceae bacterium]|nr:ElyC/SanA/YdcF family protein [Anaerolineaceae bacterium]
MALFLMAVALVILALPRLGAELFAQPRIMTPEDVQPAPVAIVFGAGLTYSGEPTPVLQDRVKTAAQLYFGGKVKKLLMSGDNRFLYYNEPGSMKEYALGLGVPEEDIVLDYAGRRTYDTCFRARAIFGVQQAILVTQRFHLPRALLLCNGMGIKAAGVAADQRTYAHRASLYWNLRELPGISLSLVEIWITHPLPVLGNPEPIFPGVTPSSPF